MLRWTNLSVLFFSITSKTKPYTSKHLSKTVLNVFILWYDFGTINMQNDAKICINVQFENGLVLSITLILLGFELDRWN